MTSINQITDLLRLHPGGLSAAEVCAHCGASKGSLTSRLSKMAAYGIIRRTTDGTFNRYFPPAVEARP